MTKEALAKVVQRAISDAGFRRQLNSDPAGALRGFDLSAEEMSALRTGNAGRLSTLGIDQRMSKAFAIGGAVAATRMAQSDLTAGSPTALDDDSTAGRTIIPHDPEAASTADLDGAAASRSASTLNDDPDGFLAANARASGGTGSVRTGDDWKYADRSTGQASAAPVEGSPEAAAAAQQASGSGMASYPAHHGLAGPSAVGSARSGDDWKYADRSTGQANAASVEGSPEADAAAQAAASGSGRIGSARLDDASASSSGANAINDDPDGFLAANKNADFSGSTAGDGTAFVDESEGYLTKVGYDPSAASPNAKATWSGDENAGPSSNADDDDGASPNATEGGPNVDS